MKGQNPKIVLVCAVGLLSGSVDSARAQDGASGRAGGTMARRTRGRGRRLLRYLLLILAQLRHWAASQHRRESPGNIPVRDTKQALND